MVLFNLNIVSIDSEEAAMFEGKTEEEVREMLDMDNDSEIGLSFPKSRING